MITYYLALFTLSIAMGKEPPEILFGFTDADACRAKKQQIQHEHGKDMANNGVAVACLKVEFDV